MTSKDVPEEGFAAQIRKGKEDRLSVQKKTFTKWANSKLASRNLEINDLFEDLKDGVLLLELLEAISEEKLPKPDKGKGLVLFITILSFFSNAKITKRNETK